MTLHMEASGARDARTERYELIIVGATAAGLAIARQFCARDVDVVVIDSASRFATRRLARLARRGELNVRLGTPIIRVTWDGEHFAIHTGGVRYEATQLVVAPKNSLCVQAPCLWPE